MILLLNYAAYNGGVYRNLVRDGVSFWRRLELYLPGDTGTYNEPIPETFERLVNEMEAGKRCPSYADGVRYQIKDGKMVPTKKERA